MRSPSTVGASATSDAAQSALALADAALGAAGHEMTDPVVRRIGSRVAARQISGDEGAREILELYKAGHFHR